MWLWLDEGIINPDNIQIDYITARKDGVLGLALMNESAQPVTTTVALGDKVSGGVSYNGTADLYDKNGKIGTVEVQNGVFTVNVPAKGLSALVLKNINVKTPAFARLSYSNTETEIGATMSHHRNGKGYALQMTPENYYAYVYVADLPETTSKLTMTYTADGKTETVSETVYPFEFIIEVEDAESTFDYTLSATDANGHTHDYGGGRLMTNAKSKALGIRYEKPAVTVTVPGLVVADEAKNNQFEAFKLKYTVQGGDAKAFRFVVNRADIPFEVTAENIIGLPVRGYLIDGESQQEFDSVIIGYEERANDMCTLLVYFAGVNNSKYASTAEGGTHSWDLTIYPLNK